MSKIKLFKPTSRMTWWDSLSLNEKQSLRSHYQEIYDWNILAYKLKGENIVDELYARQKMEELKETFSPYNVKFE